MSKVKTAAFGAAAQRRATVAKGSTAVVFAIVVIVMAALVSAGAATGQGSPYNSVTGGVTVTFANYPAPGESTTEQIVISAHDGPNGPRGTIVFRSPLAAVPVAIAHVTCLIVIDDEAWVGGTFAEPFLYTASRSLPPARIQYFAVQLLDSGSSGSGTPDAVHPVVFDDRPRPTTFSPCGIDLALFPVDQGNLVVHEAVGS